MKKIFAIFGASLMVFACTKNMTDIQNPSDSGSEPTFVAALDSPQSKVLISQGKSTWEVDDVISIFSVAAGAEAGVSVGVNYPYKASSASATTEFVQAVDAIPAADKYYAFYPEMPTYPTNLKANDAVGFTAVNAGDAVTDYRFMPITINTSATFTYDSATGMMSSSFQTPYYAVAEAAAPGQSVNFVFKPIMPVIEFGLKGVGTVKTVELAYEDASTDALDNDSNKWLSGKGVFDISTGILTTTNTSDTGYSKTKAILTTTDADYIRLNPETPIYFQITVGRFEITKGLTLTFTDKDGGVITKTIWTDNTYKGMTDEGKPKFISQVVNVTDVKLDSDSYYEVEMSDIVWSDSYIHDIKDSENHTIATITKEFFGAKQNKQGIVAYPAPYLVQDYTKGHVLQVTLDEGAAPTANVHGGFLNAWTTHADSVVYTAGTSAPIQNIYVKGDGTEILFTAPDAEIKSSRIAPYTLTSTSGEVHPLVKIGERFWTACGYKTTKLIDGTELTILEKREGQKNSDEYLWQDTETGAWVYNAFAMSINNSQKPKFTNKIAPEGWTLPSCNDWKVDLADFLGGKSSYDNMQTALLYDRNSYMLSTTTWKDLGYFSTWASETIGTSKSLYMLSCNDGGDPGSSSQDYFKMFEVRLVSKK